jgi:tRNA dimethylallyltransferase
MPKRKDKLIVILGPTACGKTKLAVKLAKFLNSEIISADSRQVYKSMDIGTGKDLKEYGNIPYHLIDIISPKKQFTLAQYQKLAYQAIDDIIKRNKMPFLVGGTGLYLQAVIDGYQLSEIKVNQKLRNNLNKKTLKQLQALTKKLKIKLNQSDFNNKRRLIRHIEILKGLSLAKSRDEKNFKPKKKPRYDCLILGIKYPKEVINKRIDKRLKERLEKEGMINEVKKLRKQGLSWQRLENFGLEYKWLAYYLQKKITYDEMAIKLATAIHQFAKRQLTWFSAHGGSASGGKKGKRIKWIKDYNEAKKLINNFLNN